MIRTIERIEKVEHLGGFAVLTLSGGLTYYTLPAAVAGYAIVDQWELMAGDVVDVSADQDGLVTKFHQVIFHGEDIQVRYIRAAMRRN